MTLRAIRSWLDKAMFEHYVYDSATVTCCSTGFWICAYHLFSISTVTTLLGRLYYGIPGSGKPGILPVSVHTTVVGSALCGALIGQLFFGWAGDKWGRGKMYRITSSITLWASLASGLSFGSSPTSLMATLGFFRFWVGFGIGGLYPLLATVMSEDSNKNNRGSLIASVFAFQGFGILFTADVSLVALSFLYLVKRTPFFYMELELVGSTPPEADFIWRMVLMSAAILPARRILPETPRYTTRVQQYQYKTITLDMEKALNPHTDPTDEAAINHEPVDKPYGLFSKTFVRRHGTELLGTTTTWFFQGFAFYSQSLLQKNIFTAVGWLPAASSMSPLFETFSIVRLQVFITWVSIVHGFWFSMALIDRIGRKKIQLMGFLLMALFMFTLAYDFYGLKGQSCGRDFCLRNHWRFIFLYALTLFFSSFGPNTTTLVVPAELFPTRLRSTCHGISSACGTAGAILGVVGFLYTTQSSEEGYPDEVGIRNWLLILAFTNCLGFFFTFFIPETKGKSLEDLNGESDDSSGFFYTSESSSSCDEGYRNGYHLRRFIRVFLIFAVPNFIYWTCILFFFARDKKGISLEDLTGESDNLRGTG